MKKKQNRKKTPEEIGVNIIEAMDREFHEQSDRIVAIVGAAYLDSMLDSLLKAVFIDSSDESDNILRPDAPLGSSGAKYQLAYCLGLITRDQRDDLKIIAKIRNVFAHDYNLQEFNISPIRDHCASLKQIRLLTDMSGKVFSGDEVKSVSHYIKSVSGTPREIFRMSVIWLFGSLLRRVAYIRRVDSIDWYTYDPDAVVGPSGVKGN